MKRNLRRLLSLVMAFVMIYSLIGQAFAGALPNKDDVVASSMLTGAKVTPVSAIQKISEAMTSNINAVRTSLNSDIDVSLGKILEGYAQAMVAYDWLCCNFYAVGAEDAEDYISILRIPQAADSTSGIFIDTVEFYNMMEGFYALIDDIKAKEGLFTAGWDLTNGKVPNAISVMSSSSLPSLESLKTGDGIASDLVNSPMPAQGIRHVLEFYCDAQILAVLVSKMEELEGFRDLSSNTELKSSVDELLKLEDNPEKAQAIIQAYRDDISPYLDVYNNIHATLNTYWNMSLDNFEQDEVTYYGKQLKHRDVSQWVSKTTYTLWHTIYTPSSPESPPTQPDDIQVDLTQGALNLMSNCTIRNGAIVMDENPELKTVGYAILGAGAVYDPFVSLAGCDEYMAVVNSFLPTETDKENFKQVLQKALNTKKPLYKTQGKKSSWSNEDDLAEIPSATYAQASLADLLKIDKGQVTAFAVIKGSMTPSVVDSSTWEYTQGNTPNTQKKPDGTTETTGDLTISNDNISNVAGTSGVVTVGTTELSATSAQMTMPVLITAGREEAFFAKNNKGFAARVGGLTSLIIHNAAQDVRNNKYMQTPETSMLFMNGLGDIVLSDNTIVMPAIANPLLYNYGNEYSSMFGETYADLFINGKESDTGENQMLCYYPYTATFMNHYPSATLGPSDSEGLLGSIWDGITNPFSGDVGQLSVQAETDKDKYIICVEDNQLYTKRIKAIGDSAKLTARGGVEVADMFGGCFSPTSDETQAASILNIAAGKAGFNWRNFSLLSGKGTTQIEDALDDDEYFGSGSTLMITRATASNPETGLPYFPLTNSDADIDENFSMFLKMGGPVTTSVIRYISNSAEGSAGLVSSGVFNIGHYIQNFLGEGQLGTAYAETLEKNYQISYDDLVADSSNRFTKFFVQICENAIDNLGMIDGVLAIKGPYQNTFFNAIVNFVQEFYLLICVALMVIVAAKFFKGHFNMIYVCFIGLMCVAGFEVYANWLPTLVPQVYNFVVNDVIEDTVWNTVAHQAEKYDQTYRESSNKDTISGELKPYTATITLYSLSNAEIASVAGRVGIDEERIRKGETVYLDYEAGIFVQGNEIRMSIDHLLFNNSMRGLYKTQWEALDQSVTTTPIEPIDVAVNDNPYSIQLINPYVSLEAYYTPYDHFERQLLKNLNTFSNIFRIERNVISYNNGELYKDAFVYNAFVHSGIFTAPGNDEILSYNIASNSTLGNGQYTGADILNLCNVFFNLKDEYGEPSVRATDWLNLYDMFYEPDNGFQTSLWGHVMMQRQWYNDDWTMTEKGQQKISDLIYYVNNHTKQWVIKNVNQMLYLSDENAIKLTSLYATTCFTHYLSEFTEWMYPNYINASDIALKDVLYGSMTTLYDRNHAYDGTVVNTIALNLGIFGVLFLLLIVVFSTVFIFIVTYMVPVLYGMFGMILVFKLVNDSSGVGLVKGYVKVTGVSAILYIIFSLSLKLVDLGGYQWYGYLGCALLMGLCLYFLFWVVLSIVQDAGEMGNNTLGRNLLRGLDKITRGSVRKLAASTTHLTTSIQNHRRYQISNRYGRGYGVDDYDRPFGRRRPRGYDEGYDRDYGYGPYAGDRDFADYSRSSGFREEPPNFRRQRGTRFNPFNSRRF